MREEELSHDSTAKSQGRTAKDGYQDPCQHLRSIRFAEATNVAGKTFQGGNQEYRSTADTVGQGVPEERENAQEEDLETIA